MLYLPLLLQLAVAADPCVVEDTWGQWSGCSVNCGGGTKTRTRAITHLGDKGGADCEDTSETEECNTDDCDSDHLAIVTDKYVAKADHDKYDNCGEDTCVAKCGGPQTFELRMCQSFMCTTCPSKWCKESCKDLQAQYPTCRCPNWRDGKNSYSASDIPPSPTCETTEEKVGIEYGCPNGNAGECLLNNKPVANNLDAALTACALTDGCDRVMDYPGAAGARDFYLRRSSTDNERPNAHVDANGVKLKSYAVECTRPGR